MKILFQILAFQIVSFSAFGAITERYVNSAGSGAADGTSEANAMSYATFVDYMSTGGSFTAAPGDRFNIKGVISRTTTSDTFLNGGASNAPVIIRGYATTIGDGYQGRTVNGTGPLNTNNMAAISTTTGLLSITGGFIILESLYLSGARNGAAVSTTTGTGVFFKSCRIDDNSTGSATALNTQQASGTLLDCDLNLLAASGGTAALISNAAGTRIVGNRITGKTAIGVSLQTSANVDGNVIFNSTIGIDMNTAAAVTYNIWNNTITGCSSNGIKESINVTLPVLVINNMITDNGGWGMDCGSATNTVWFSNNRFRDNTLGAITNSTDFVSAGNWSVVTTDTGGVETDYTDTSTFDYRLISTSPGLSIGLPAYIDAGGVQKSNTISAGGSTPGVVAFPFAQ